MLARPTSTASTLGVETSTLYGRSYLQSYIAIVACPRVGCLARRPGREQVTRVPHISYFHGQLSDLKFLSVQPCSHHRKCIKTPPSSHFSLHLTNEGKNNQICTSRFKNINFLWEKGPKVVDFLRLWVCCRCLRDKVEPIITSTSTGSWCKYFQYTFPLFLHGLNTRPIYGILRVRYKPTVRSCH